MFAYKVNLSHRHRLITSTPPNYHRCTGRYQRHWKPHCFKRVLFNTLILNSGPSRSSPIPILPCVVCCRVTDVEDAAFPHSTSARGSTSAYHIPSPPHTHTPGQSGVGWVQRLQVSIPGSDRNTATWRECSENGLLNASERRLPHPAATTSFCPESFYLSEIPRFLL